MIRKQSLHEESKQANDGIFQSQHNPLAFFGRHVDGDLTRFPHQIDRGVIRGSRQLRPEKKLVISIKTTACSACPSTDEMPEAGSTGQGKASTSSRSSKKDVIHMERSRREKMTEFYTMLQSMVPNLFPKATRTRIVDEAIAYIKGLEEVIGALEAQKAAREASSGPATLHSQRSSTVEVSTSANTAFFAISFVARPGMVMKVLQVFEDHKAEVLNATIACNDGSVTVTVTASEMEEEALGKIKGDLIVI